MENLLGKLNDAIEICETENTEGVKVYLTYSELLLLRRYEMTDEYSISLLMENLRKGKAFRENS